MPAQSRWPRIQLKRVVTDSCNLRSLTITRDRIWKEDVGFSFHIFIVAAVGLTFEMSGSAVMAALIIPPWLVSVLPAWKQHRWAKANPRKLWKLRPLEGEPSLRMRPMRLRGISADDPFRAFVRREILAAEAAELGERPDEAMGSISA